jgi:hypothetical protein
VGVGSSVGAAIVAVGMTTIVAVGGAIGTLSKEQAIDKSTTHGRKRLFIRIIIAPGAL